MTFKELMVINCLIGLCLFGMLWACKPAKFEVYYTVLKEMQYEKAIN